MYHIWLYPVSAIMAYAVGGINPAIVLSKKIYHKDIRECGSGNPGFTNFKRSFGSKWAWWVLLLDLMKGALPSVLSGWLFVSIIGNWQLGAAFAGLCTMLGHAYPIWYKFKGGKGFLVYMAAVWVVDWRAGAAAFALLVILLLTVKIMSVSTMCAVLSTPLTLYFAGAELSVIIICLLSALFMIWRHKENIKRLIKGTESKFYFGKKA